MRSKNYLYFDKSKYISEFSRLFRSPYFLYVGRLASYKGIDILIRSAQILPHISFVFAGEGPESSIVANALKDKSLTNVFLLNYFIPESLKHFLIENCYALLFPSVTSNEAFGLVQLEAMAHKKPILNTDLGTGVNFVAPNKLSALTSKPNDINSFTKNILLLWSNKELASILGNQGYQRYKKLFSASAFSSAWRSLILQNHHP